MPQVALAQEPATPAAPTSGVQLRRCGLPVLRRTDVVVIGGSTAGVAAALEFARAGRKVVLVEHRTYLGREVSATLKPWVDLGKLAGSADAPPVISATLKKQATDESEGELPLWMDAFKVTLENMLLAGVDLMYAALPTEAVIKDGTLRSVVVGNKAGRQVLLGRVVIRQAA